MERGGGEREWATLIASLCFSHPADQCSMFQSPQPLSKEERGKSRSVGSAGRKINNGKRDRGGSDKNSAGEFQGGRRRTRKSGL